MAALCIASNRGGSSCPALTNALTMFPTDWGVKLLFGSLRARRDRRENTSLSYVPSLTRELTTTATFCTQDRLYRRNQQPKWRKCIHLIFGMKHHLSSTRHASMFQPMAKSWLWVLAATEPAHLRPLQQLTWPAFTNNSIYLCVYWTPTNLPIPVRGTRLGTALGWRGNERRSNNGTPIRGGQIV